jgi:hypothetical protein
VEDSDKEETEVAAKEGKGEKAEEGENEAKKRVEQLLAQVVLPTTKKESCETSKRRVGPKR